MQAIPLRAVLDVEEYDCERQKLQEWYGNPDDKSEGVVAKRDQAFAELFYRSGWTQEQLAEREGKSQQWVVCRLRLGRFLAYATNTTAVVSTITEWRFRGFWERTDKTALESVRFDVVIGLMQAPSLEPEPVQRNTPKADYAKEILRPILESGQKVNQTGLAKELGISAQAVITAYNYEMGRLEGLREAEKTNNGVDLDGILGKTAQEKLATLEARLRTRMAAEFDSRVQQEVRCYVDEHLMPLYKERLEKAELLMRWGKPFTNVQFLSLLRALHSDSSDAERRQAAFVLLKEKEVLLRPEERDRPLSGGLPGTLAELLARRKAPKADSRPSER